MRCVPIYISSPGFLFAVRNSIDRQTIQKGQKAYCVHYRKSDTTHGCFTLTIDSLFQLVRNCHFPSEKEKEMFLLAISSKIPTEADIFYDWRVGGGIYENWRNEVYDEETVVYI